MHSSSEHNHMVSPLINEMVLNKNEEARNTSNIQYFSTVEAEYSTSAALSAATSIPNCCYIESLKGKRMILIDGYRFSLMKMKEHDEARSQGKVAKCRWRCSTHCNVRCTAVVHTLDDRITFVNNNHNHAPSHLRTKK